MNLESLNELKAVSLKVTELEMFIDTGGRHAAIPPEILENSIGPHLTERNVADAFVPRIACPFPRCNGLGHIYSHLHASHRALCDCPHYFNFRKMVLNKNGPTMPINIIEKEYLDHQNSNNDEQDNIHNKKLNSEEDSNDSEDEEDDTEIELSEFDYEWQTLLASAVRLPAAGQGSRLKKQLSRAIAVVPRKRSFKILKQRLQQMEKTWKFRDASTNKREMLQLVRLSGGATRTPSISDALRLINKLTSAKTSQHVNVLVSISSERERASRIWKAL